MRIVIDAVGASTGGNVTILNNLLYHLISLNSNVDIISIFIEDKSFNINQFYSSDRIKYYPVLNYSSLVKKVIWQQCVVQRRAKELNANMLLSITNSGSYFPKVKTVIYFHQSLLFTPNKILNRFFDLQSVCKFKIQKIIVLSGFFKSSNIIVQTETVKESIISEFPSLKDKLLVCYPGVNLNIFNDREPQNNIKLNIKELNKFKLLFLSHPSEYKNFEILFRAAKVLKENGTRAIFLLTLNVNQKDISDNRYKLFINKYLREIEKLDVNEYFLFTGIISSNTTKNKLIEMADAVINPSFVESFPLTYTEGMFFKKPFISADRPYAREICGNSSLYFDPNSPHDLADKVISLVSNKNLTNELSEKSSLRLNYFNPVSRWGEVFKKIGL